MKKLLLALLLACGLVAWPLAALANPAQPAGQAVAAKIAVNTASTAELEALPGIGPVVAQRIVEYRTSHGAFTSLDDLLQVKGVGEKVLEKIRPQATLN